MRMNAADTSASSAIADCTPLTVVSRSRTTALIETFIKDVSTTSTNMAMASRTASLVLAGDSVAAVSSRWLLTVHHLAIWRRPCGRDHARPHDAPGNHPKRGGVQLPVDASRSGQLNLEDAPMTVTGDAPSNLSVRQAAFIGVGAMVGAGIFALLGAAGEVAGAAVWVSFLLAGAIAALQGYSFAKFGARYPTGAGLLEYVFRAFGPGHFTGTIAWMLLSVNAIITAMVAASFGSYASAAAADNDHWVKPFAVLVILVMSV